MSITRIDQNQQLIALVRQQLGQVSRAKVARTAKNKNNTSSDSIHDVGRLRKLAAREGISDEAMQRALVQGILTEEFGEGLINDAQFQQVVDRITRLLQADERTMALLQHSVRQLSEN